MVSERYSKWIAYSPERSAMVRLIFKIWSYCSSAEVEFDLYHVSGTMNLG